MLQFGPSNSKHVNPRRRDLREKHKGYRCVNSIRLNIVMLLTSHSELMYAGRSRKASLKTSSPSSRFSSRIKASLTDDIIDTEHRFTSNFGMETGERRRVITNNSEKENEDTQNAGPSSQGLNFEGTVAHDVRNVQRSILTHDALDSIIRRRSHLRVEPTFV